jgi:ADP-L-glycero-D-manno-heptose 6-epimerase
MASVIFHAYNQINKNGNLNLFQSHNDDYNNGEQLRDFVYVKDILKVLISLLQHPIHSGIYNLGTGKARTFNDLAENVFKALDVKSKIKYIATPESIRDSYQYFTEADLSKLNSQFPNFVPTTLEEGIGDYVNNYLKKSLLYK